MKSPDCRNGGVTSAKSEPRRYVTARKTGAFRRGGFRGGKLGVLADQETKKEFAAKVEKKAVLQFEDS